VVWVGIILGLVSAFGQAVGSIIVKPALDAGIDPMAALTVRIGAAAFILLAVRALGGSEAATAAVKIRHYFYASMNALIAIVIGASLLLYAFTKGDVGIASVLAATTPVLILPWLWFQTKECPAPGAWLGAVIAVLGTAAIFHY